MTSLSQFELQSKIAEWRARALDGTLTLEEMRDAISLLRAGRVSAAAASDSSRRAKAKVAIPSGDDLLKELGDM